MPLKSFTNCAKGCFGGIRRAWGATAVVLGLALVACDDSTLDTLRGRWGGSIRCGARQYEVLLVLDVFADRVSGTAVTSTQNLDKEWTVRGSQRESEQQVPCADDTCTSNDDCIEKGGTLCDDQGLCQDCKEVERINALDLTLEDADIQLANPVFDLRRTGNSRMVGSISSFCPDGEQADPGVELVKR